MTEYGEQLLTSGNTPIYSGHGEKDAAHILGVGIILSRYPRSSLVDWRSRGSVARIFFIMNQMKRLER